LRALGIRGIGIDSFGMRRLDSLVTAGCKLMVFLERINLSSEPGWDGSIGTQVLPVNASVEKEK
jgi:hypothetical protein